MRSPCRDLPEVRVQQSEKRLSRVPSLKLAYELFPINRDDDSGLPEDEAIRRGASWNQIATP